MRLKSDANDVAKIIRLYKQGDSIYAIAKDMKKDRSSIRWWIKKYLNGEDMKPKAKHIRRQSEPKPHFKVVGKTYKDYLAEAKGRGEYKFYKPNGT